jgi:N-acetylglucosaminyl-diphospho-decaprenol L-rhamnosyltransferase
VSAPSIAVVVVGYDSGDVWPEFFFSLAKSALRPESVVVVENSPTAPTDLEAVYGLPVTTLHRPDNPGYGSAINYGMTQVPQECSIVVMCNPDIIFEVDTLDILVTALENYPSAGIAGPAIKNPDGSLYPSARAFPGIRVGVGHAILGEIWKNNPWTRRYLGRYEGRDNRVVDWLSGSCMVARRDALGDVGGFDEGYFMFLEDVDLCFRLKRAGWRSLYVPSAEIMHSGGHSTKKRMADMVKIHHESARRFLFRLYDKPHFWPLRQVLRFGLMVRSWLAPLKYKNSLEAD